MYSTSNRYQEYNKKKISKGNCEKIKNSEGKKNMSTENPNIMTNSFSTSSQLQQDSTMELRHTNVT